MFTGSIVALITPMNYQGNVCRKSLKKLIDYHVYSGTSAIVSVGTTGESATLSHSEHSDVILMTLDLADGRIPIIAGTGANATAEGVLLTKRLTNTGVIGCLTVTPYYNRPTQEGLYQHFKIIAESTDLPQIIYNVPSRTGCDILPKTIARLSKIKNIIGIKEATGDLSRISQIRDLVNKDFILISGDDITALDSMQLGSTGIISVTANIAAREMVTLCILAQQGKFFEARRLNQRLMLLHQTLFCETNPIPVKWAAKYLGLIIEDTLRLPMTPLTKKGQNKMIQAIIKAGLYVKKEY
ncbi:4-hydroxy-tetrahydrodipicolinate synthase [Pantoea sp. Mhis]|uniref:4-hydroxy-tetrahydrodipicolinate synthase n=1 Tax=Pantoea sp. Mhis TaxID=2576759 RepID=UPI001357F45B|nr:4-hydroxy-tetrahydrodipicolinate synthase [Pantoea sp. Mhis]MXP56588.1 4-hydroxy-tetrahydrodipicolinate synthase [Pantoea sp. Mhis]